MNQNYVKTIGINDVQRKDSYLVYVNQVDGLKGILNRDFSKWSNFDSWESISVQQWIFSRALEVYSCLLYTSPSPRDRSLSRMPSSVIKKFLLLTISLNHPPSG